MASLLHPDFTFLDAAEETVHHAIIDLYELHDSPAVTAHHVVIYCDLPLATIEAAMHSLCEAGILTYGTDDVVLGIDNLDYYPIPEDEEG